MKLRVDVIVMFKEDAYSINDWVLQTDDSGNFGGVPDNDLSQIPETKWGDMALEINNRARSGKHEPVEIFLYLRDGLLTSIHYFGTLKKIAAAAQHHVWAGHVYVVWDKTHETTVENSFQELDKVNLLIEFCCALLQERVADLIEISLIGRSPTGLSSEDLRRFLRGRALTSRNRRADLKALVQEDGWSHMLRNESRDLAWLLNVFEGRCLPSSAPSHMLIYEASAGQPLEALIEKSKAIHKVVATLGGSYSDEVKKVCDRQNPPLDILTFQSIFEVFYALLQLNDAGKAKKRLEGSYLNGQIEQGISNADVPVEIEYVEIDKVPRFPPSTTTSPLNLLITSAFDDKAEPDHSKAAAKEIGSIRRNVTSLQDVEVHPYMSCQSFPKLLESKQYTAWIHLSHGAEGKLYDPQKELYVPPESWLNCFKAYGDSLSLVIFSSCSSARAAKLFATAGVGIAIGFKNKVLPVATEILAQKVVPAAMHSGGNQEVILKAFHDACRSLAARITDKGENYNDAQPIAFCSIRK